MRILLGPVKKSHPEVCDIRHTLTDHEVVTYHHEDADLVYDYACTSFSDLLRALPAGWQPDVVFFLSPEYNGVLPGIEECPYPLVGTVGDWNLGFHAIRDICGAFDLLLTDRAGVSMFRDAGCANVAHAKLFGYVPALHYRSPEVAQVIDVSIVGNLNHEIQRERSLWLARLAAMTDTHDVRILTGLFGDDYRRALQQSKVTFNRSIRGEMNMRGYEAPACGSLMFYEEENLEVRDVYEDGAHCVLYNIQNLEALIDRYLADTEARSRIIEAAHVRVQEYSIGRQWQRIVELVKRLGVASGERRFAGWSEPRKALACARQALQCTTPGAHAVAEREVSAALAQPDAAVWNDAAVLHADIATRVGDAAVSQQRFQAALGCFEQSVAGGHPLALANRAMLLAAASHPAALEELEKSISTLRLSAAADLSDALYFPRGYDGFKVEHERISAAFAGDSERAGERLRSLYLWRLFDRLGDLRAAAGDHSAAVAAYADAAEKRESGGTSFKRACALERLGLRAEAIAELQGALLLEPFHFDARARLVALLTTDARSAEAAAQRADARRLIRACPAYEPLRATFAEPTVAATLDRRVAAMSEKQYRILTFNWHEPYMAAVCKSGHQFDVVAPYVIGRPRIDSDTAWDERKRPVPPNVSLLTNLDEVKRRFQAGVYDLAICWTLFDLQFLAGSGLPRIFCPLSSPKNDLAADYLDPAKRQEWMARINTALDGATVLYTTREMGEESLGGYGLPGTLVGVAVDDDDFSGYTGEEAAVLRVGNCIAERWFLNYPLQRQVLDGFPHHILGANPGIPEARPAGDWNELRDHYRQLRCFFHSFDPAFQEAPLPMSAIEAMMTGMPLVTTPHPLSPILDGVNGFVAESVPALRDRIQQLLADRDLAAELGRNARATVQEQYGLAPFLARWQEGIDACVRRAAPSQPTVWFAAPAWEDAGTWQPVVERHMRQQPQNAGTLRLYAGPLTGSSTAVVYERVGAFLSARGLDRDDAPEIEIVDSLPSSGVAQFIRTGGPVDHLLGV